MKKILLLLVLGILTSGLIAQGDWTKNLPQDKIKKGTLTFQEIQKAFYQAYPKDKVVNGKRMVNGNLEKVPGWKQFKRWEYYWEARVDKETGLFPNKSAIDDAVQLKNNRTLINGGGNWENMGPNESYGGYAGLGRINCIAFHPEDNDTYWVGSPSGGLWKTTDDGNTWTVLTDNNNVLGVSAIAISADYATSNTLFIGTGDRDAGSLFSLGGGQYHDNNGIGILKSTDGGSTWQTTGLTFNVSEQKVINKILINPNNAQEMLAATSAGIYKTTDGGENWSITSSNINFIDMEYKPNDPNTLYASTKDWYQTKIYRSLDAGNTWTEQQSVSGRRTELAVSPDEPNWVYAISSNEDMGLQGIYKSTDSGNSFSATYLGDEDKALLSYSCVGAGSNTGQGAYDLCIGADPNDANTVYIGGINIWKSENAGEDWEILTHWYSDCSGNATTVHADQHCLEFQNGSSVLFGGNDGGLYKTSNEGSSWEYKGSGLAISQIYRIGVSQTTPDKIICGLQDNGTKLTNLNSWEDLQGGDGMECIIDYTDSQVQYATFPFGQINRTLNDWNFSDDISDNIPVSESDRGAWVTPYVMDPVDNQTLYVGYSDLWKTTNRGNTWTKISTVNSSDKLRSIAVSPSNNQVIYIADNDHIWKTTDGGNSWSGITYGIPVHLGNITYIAVKADNPNTVWVSLGGYNNRCVYQTTNGGIQWTNISTGLPSLPVMSIVQNTQNTTDVELYAATDIGVYQKIGDGSWNPYCTNLPNVVVTELEIFYDDNNPDNSRLIAGTFGRGLWKTPLEEAIVEVPVADFSTNTSTVCQFTNISFNDLSTGHPISWTWDFGDGSPNSNLQNPTHLFSTAGTFTVSLTVSNNAGTSTETKEGYITVIEKPYAGGDASLTLCDGESPTEEQLFNALEGNPDTGGTWSQSGSVYTYTVEASSPCSPDEATVNVTQSATPQASFSLDSTNIPTIHFTNTSTYAESQTWNMGDGAEYTSTDVTHTYQSNGTYTVILEVSNTCGTDQVQQDINIVNVGTSDLLNSTIKVYPNPTDSELHIELPEENILVKLVSLDGKVLKEIQTNHQKTVSINMQGLSQGTYNLQLYFSNDKSVSIKVLKK